MSSDIIHNAIRVAFDRKFFIGKHVDPNPGDAIKRMQREGVDFSEVTAKDCDARDEDIRELVPSNDLDKAAKLGRYLRRQDKK
jgi:hypothetical protein